MTTTIDIITALLNQIESGHRPWRDDVAKAVRAVEARIGEKLRGQRLLGLPNLGTATTPLYGVRLDAGTPTTGRNPRIPFPTHAANAHGPTVTVLTDEGVCATVRAVRHGQGTDAWFAFEVTPKASPEPSDLAAMVTVLPDVLHRHAMLAAAAQTSSDAAVKAARAWLAQDRKDQRAHPGPATPDQVRRASRRGSGVIVED